MQRKRKSQQHQEPISRRERGAALLEFSIVIGLLVLVLIAIITYGLLLSYRQVLTQAATDGARAASITTDDPGTVGDERVEAARAAVNASLGAEDRSCLPSGDKGLTCHITINPCPTEPGETCIEIDLVHDNENYPVVATIVPFDELTPELVKVSTRAIVTDLQ